MACKGTFFLAFRGVFYPFIANKSLLYHLLYFIIFTKQHLYLFIVNSLCAIGGIFGVDK